MVNAGAIATTSLVPGATAEEKWAVRARRAVPLRRPRAWCWTAEVYDSEAATNLRNQGIAHLLDSYGRVYSDPDEATDVYTQQCSLLVTAEDLAVMGATLADGGVNPVTGERVVDAATLHAGAGRAGHRGPLRAAPATGSTRSGLPGKSGVSGGIVTVAPGKGGLGTCSPPLDAAGNSVRGQLLTRVPLRARSGLNLFASVPRPGALIRRRRARAYGVPMSFFDALGWAGAVMILGAYGLLTLGRWDAASLRYQVTNTWVLWRCWCGPSRSRRGSRP